MICQVSQDRWWVLLLLVGDVWRESDHDDQIMKYPITDLLCVHYNHLYIYTETHHTKLNVALLDL